jgi:uncharacterized membrane protein YedE/YeeE
MLAHRPPFYVVGLGLGLIVVGLYATLNERIGVLGGFSDVVEMVERRRPVGWKGWFLVGVVGGGLLFAFLLGSWGRAGGYGWLGDGVLAGPVLVGAGVLIGFGAKTAGGCTSGNGLGGCSTGSPAGFAATGTFMGVAIAGTFVLRWLFG